MSYFLQGTTAAPAPAPGLLVNLFGSILDQVDNTIEYVTDSLSEIIGSAIRPPSAQILPVMTNLTTTLNTLMNSIVDQATDNSILLSNMVLPFNRLVDSGNKASSPFLFNIFSQIVDRLNNALDRLGNVVQESASNIRNIRSVIRTTIQNILATLIPRLNTCNLKLTNLGLTSASAAMKTYVSNTTAIFQQLDSTLDAQFLALSTQINVTATEGTVYATTVTSDLTERLVDMYLAVPFRSVDYETCLTEQSEMITLVQQMINENVAMCVEAATTEATATHVGLEEQANLMQEESASFVTDTCKCVENVTTSSAMLVRAQASTCATAALKKLSSDPIKAEAEAMADTQNAALEDIKATFDQCYATIKSDVDPILINFVNGLIDSCEFY